MSLTVFLSPHLLGEQAAQKLSVCELCTRDPLLGPPFPLALEGAHGPDPLGRALGSPPEPGPDREGKTKNRAHLTLALSTPIPKLMVATITGTFSSIHSFCTTVLSEAFRPIEEGDLGKGTRISLGVYLGFDCTHTLNPSLTSCVTLSQALNLTEPKLTNRKTLPSLYVAQSTQ